MVDHQLRLACVRAVKAGKSLRATAREFGVSVGSVRNWCRLAIEGKLEAMPSVPEYTRQLKDINLD